ncbi:hypothetical protein WJX73_004042 [Symbiochloris irregularis]|uniref:Uncharacterized protein n=1 Tax=Symbiochloris irregularis TaxID=706552 RepID=A0AAW1NF91_9CHLO
MFRAVAQQMMTMMKQVTALFYSGSYLAGVQEMVAAVEDIELLSFQAPGEAVQDFDTSEEWGYQSGGWPAIASSTAPALAPDQANLTVVFDIDLYGPDAVLTNDFTVSSLYTALLGMLTPRYDWVTADNTAVTAIMALPSTTVAALASDEVNASPSTSAAYGTGGRRLLARATASEHGGPQRTLLQVESSQSDGNDPDIPATSVMSMAPSPQSSAPLNGMRVTFRVIDLSWVGVETVYDALIYIIPKTNQLLAALRAHNVVIYGLQLTSFTPDPVGNASPVAIAAPPRPLPLPLPIPQPNGTAAPNSNRQSGSGEPS